MIYRTKDGELITGPNARALVAALHRLSLTQERSNREFMRVTAERAETQVGKPIRTRKAESFIADLVSVGLLFEEVVQ